MLTSELTVHMLKMYCKRASMLSSHPRLFIHSFIGRVTTRFVQVQFLFQPGHFGCNSVWHTHLPVHQRLMDTSGRTGLSRGFKAVKSVLDRFGVSNRKDMFVYKDRDGAVFYFRWVFCFSKAAFKLRIFCHMVSQPACRHLLFPLVGSLRNDDGDGNENGKKEIG